MYSISDQHKTEWTLSALYLPSVDHQIWLPVKVLQKTKRKLISGRTHYAFSSPAEDTAHNTCKLRLTSLSPLVFSCTTKTTAHPVLTLLERQKTTHGDESCMDIKPSFPVLSWNCRLLSEFFTWDTSETFQQCPQGGQGQVSSTRTITENTSVICTENLKLSTETCQTLSYWWWSQPPVHWESQIVDDWVKREKFPNNYLYYIYILRCQRGTSPLGLASRIKDRARASPHLSSLCILNTCGRKKRQSGQGVTTRQNRAANSWELLTTH